MTGGGRVGYSCVMEIVLLVVILAVFMLPSLLMGRAQKKRQSEVEAMRTAIQPGDRVVNVAGFHATVLENRGETMLVELSPGVEVEMESAGVMKRIEGPAGERPADPSADTV